MKHIVFYSGGIGSWGAAKRVIEQHGKENTILMFTDTKMEDEDLYRFLDETVEQFGCEFIHLEEGRDVWELFNDFDFIGNSRAAVCTQYLKQRLSKRWIKKNFKPSQCILYLGIDWSEAHRTKAPVKNWRPYQVEFPLCEEPYLTKEDIKEDLKRAGIKIPRLYEMGFAHNNCGGFCVKAGQGHFKLLYEKMPERFNYHARKEQELRDRLGKDVSVLVRVKDKKKHRLTLNQLREEIENEPEQIDLFDVGGCGCFVEEE